MRNSIQKAGFVTRKNLVFELKMTVFAHKRAQKEKMSAKMSAIFAFFCVSGLKTAFFANPIERYVKIWRAIIVMATITGNLVRKDAEYGGGDKNNQNRFGKDAAQSRAGAFLPDTSKES